jgi:hypothetical protein
LYNCDNGLFPKVLSYRKSPQRATVKGQNRER